MINIYDGLYNNLCGWKSSMDCLAFWIRIENHLKRRFECILCRIWQGGRLEALRRFAEDPTGSCYWPWWRLIPRGPMQRQLRIEQYRGRNNRKRYRNEFAVVKSERIGSYRTQRLNHASIVHWAKLMQFAVQPSLGLIAGHASWIDDNDNKRNSQFNNNWQSTPTI